MIGSGHLGARVSALLDGRLSAAEEERAWAHVASCPACQELVAAEGWVKTQLAGLSWAAAAAPERLKGTLAGPAWALACPGPPGPCSPRNRAGLGVVGGGLLGAAALGVVLLAAPAAQAPVLDRRAPQPQLTGPSLTVPAGSTADIGLRLPTGSSGSDRVARRPGDGVR